MSAPFLPPTIAPRPAPAAVDPPITIAVFVQSRPGLRSTTRVCGTVRVTTWRAAGAGAATYGSYAGGWLTLETGYAIGARGAAAYGDAYDAYDGSFRSTRSLAYIGRATP